MGDPFLFHLVQNAVLLLQACDDSLHRLLQFCKTHCILAAPNCEQGRFIDDVGQVCAHEPGGHRGNDFQVSIRAQRHVARMELQDSQPPTLIRTVHQHVPVEATGTQQSRIQDLGPVSGGHENDPRARIEPVHLHQQLIECLFPFLMSHRPHTTRLAQGIQLIDEDDAGGLFFGLEEQIADARRSNADEHFHEFGSADRKEGDTGLTGHCLGKEGFAGPRRTDQENAFRNLTAQTSKLLGSFQELDDLPELFLGLVHSGHVVEPDFHLFFHVDLGFTSADGHESPLALPHAV